MLKIRITPRAERDLLDIRDYIAQHNPRAAERVRAHIERAIDLLAQFPGMSRPSSKAGIAVSVVPRFGYKVYFRVSADELEIVRIRHGARREPTPDEL